MRHPSRFHASILTELTAMQTLLIATHNAHKTGEIRKILGANFTVSDLTAHPEILPTVESGATFSENAALKAQEASRIFSGLVLADDSGLEVDALDGAPGIYSARYAARFASESADGNSDDAENRKKLLEELAKTGARGKARSARFRCVIALAREGSLLATFEGAVEGTIINEEKGAGGFGYDPLFVPQGFCETFAQLDAEVKNRISHRARALKKCREALGDTDLFSDHG